MTGLAQLRAVPPPIQAQFTSATTTTTSTTTAIPVPIRVARKVSGRPSDSPSPPLIESPSFAGGKRRLRPEPQQREYNKRLHRPALHSDDDDKIAPLRSTAEKIADELLSSSTRVRKRAGSPVFLSSGDDTAEVRHKPLVPGATIPRTGLHLGPVLDAKRIGITDPRPLLEYVVKQVVPPGPSSSYVPGSAAPVVGNRPMRWTQNVCHLQSGFFEALYCALLYTRTLEDVCRELLSLPPDTVANALGEAFRDRANADVEQRDVQLVRVWAAAMRIRHLCQQVGENETNLLWWELLRASDFAGHALRKLTCWQFIPEAPCSRGAFSCPRLADTVEWIPYLTVTAAPRRRRSGLPVHLGTCIQEAVDHIYVPLDRIPQAAQCRMAFAEINGVETVYRECDGTLAVEGLVGEIKSAPSVLCARLSETDTIFGGDDVLDIPDPLILKVPRFVWARKDGVPDKETTSIRPVPYRPIALVYYEPKHYVTRALYDECWFKHSFSTLEPTSLDMAKVAVQNGSGRLNMVVFAKCYI